MIGLTSAVALVTLALLALVWQWRTGRGSTRFVLRALPAALLLLVMPVVPASLTLIRGFQDIAARGAGDVTDVAAACSAVLGPLLLGSVCFLVALGAAALLEMKAVALNRRTPPIPDDSRESSRARWHMFLLIGTSLLAIPAAVVASLPQRTVAFVMAAARSDSSVTQSPAEISEIIANRLTVGALAGSWMSIVLVVAATFSVLLFRSEPRSRRFSRYSWALLAVAGVAVVLYAVRLAVDIRAIGLAR